MLLEVSQKETKEGEEAILTKICADPKQIKPSKKSKACKDAKQQYITLMFLMHSDKRWYGELINDIENEFTRGLETFPQTLCTAFEILINYKSHKRSSQYDNNEADMFYNDHDAAGSESERD